MIRPVIHHPSGNFDERPAGARVKYLIYHYTEGDLNTSLKWLAGSNPAGKVSAHYLICEQGHIYALVDEDKRAWHAGISHWENDVNLNGTSIGIELVNPGMGPNYRDFTTPQMAALEELTFDIMTRHAISPFHVLAHSDIAPDRKIDPGDRFDWRGLAKNGIGIHPPDFEGPVYTIISDLQKKLHDYGYAIKVTGEMDTQTEFVLRAFQLHFGCGGELKKLEWLLEQKKLMNMEAGTGIEPTYKDLQSSA